MTKEIQKVSPVVDLKKMLGSDSVSEQFRNAVGENAQLFTASIVELFSGDKYLQECAPSAVVMECLKAATLKLPINKNLGFAWVIAYKGKPQFQMGYKGFVQLALRTGKYKKLHCDALYEGQVVDHNYLTGEFHISGKPTSDKAIGYFAYFKLLNGFEKSIFWDVDRVTAHAKKYSKSFNRSGSPWKTEFSEMAKKTMLSMLLKKFGILSVEMASTMGGCGSVQPTHN
jgi:recombination protein RecT